MATSLNDTFLVSPSFVKRETGLDNNLYDKYLLGAIRSAQDIKLRGILGDILLDKLKTLVMSGDIEQTANADYKALADKSQMYLAYASVVEVISRVNVKVGNMGVVKGTDQSVTSASAQDVENTRAYYQSIADDFCYMLQGYLLDNRAKYPELGQNNCNKIKSNLHSAATCGLWLGGVRGR